MRVITGSETLTVADVPDPLPGDGEVLIDVVAAGVNRADLLQRAGHYPPPSGASGVLGLEVSGRIAALGPGVAGWRPGDEVCALLAGGGYAERVVVPAAQVLPVPAGIRLAEAAALPEVACTVVSNLLLTAHLQPGELLLIHGGSSGIGTHAIQVAKALGARVAVTARNAAKLTAAAALGADITIDYTSDDFAAVLREQGGADVILDIVGAEYLRRNVAALRTGGRLVVIGLQGGRTADLDLGVLLAKRAAVFGTTLRSRPAHGPGSKAEVVAATLAHTWPLVKSGTVRPVIDSVFPLAEAEGAHDRLTGGEAIGKVLLAIG